MPPKKQIKPKMTRPTVLSIEKRKPTRPVKTDVEQCRYGLYGLRKMECLHNFEKIIPRTGVLVQGGLG